MLKKNEKKAVSLSWNEGIYLDKWTIVHFISGLIIGVIFSLFHFSFQLSLGVAILLMILWEIFEVVVEIGESFMNRIVDVVIGTAGFFIAFYFVPVEFFEKFIVLLILVIILGALELQGWRAFLKRKGVK